MAINTSTNKVRIISTTVSGLSTNSKFSDIKSPALVVNTSEGGIFYAPGDSSKLTQLAALPNHSHSAYATATQLDNYLPLTGGGISSNKIIPLDINSTSTAGIGFELKNNNNQVSQFGWSSRGTYIYDYTSKSYLGLTNDGTPYFNTYELLHANNYYNYALPKSGGNLEGPLRYGKHLAIPNAQYNTSGDVTGCIKIKIPTNPGNAMLSFWVDVFNYSNGTSYSAYISGYTFSDNNWYQPTTFLIGKTSKIIKYGHDGTNFIICIGLPTDTYSYPNIIIRDVLLGHQAATSSFNNKWNISITNDISDINFNNSNECLVLNTTNYTTYCASAGHTHNYLPLSGGTITSTEQGVATLMLNSIDNSGHSVLQFANKGTYLGALGFSSVDTPYFRTSAGAVRNLIHSGNIGTQSVASATNASNIYINNSTSSGAFPITFVSNTTKGSQALFVSTGKSLTFNPSTGNLTATKFTGNLVGNADTATTAGTANEAVRLLSPYTYENNTTISTSTTPETLFPHSYTFSAMMESDSSLFGVNNYANVLNFSGYKQYGATQFAVHYNSGNRAAIRTYIQTTSTWTPWKFLAFKDDLTSYLPKTGGTIKNGNTRNALTLDTSSTVGAYLTCSANGVAKSYFGYDSNLGTLMQDNKSSGSTILYITDQNGYIGNGTTYNTIIHSGNIGSQSVAAATRSDSLYITGVGYSTSWNWSGKTGTPDWVWGGTDGTNMYVYKPANFSVNYATSAGTATNASQLGGITAVNYVAPAKYSTTNGQSGYYLITINSTAAWMLAFRVRVYKSYTYQDIRFSGYNYGNNYWYAPYASMVDGDADTTVYFGYTSPWNLYVAIPAGNYTGIEISDVVNGYTQVNSQIKDLFTITNVTSLPGTIQGTYDLKAPDNRFAPATHSHSGYATTSSLANYLPLLGGSLSGHLSSSDYILGTGLIRVNASGSTTNFGYIKAETYNTNRSVVHIGSNYGGSSSISNSYSFDAIGIYRTCVGIGGTFTGATLSSNYDEGIKLDINGVARGSNFITTSDKRLKKNINEISSDKLSNALNVNFYEFDYVNNDNHSAGHVAQEVKEVLPEFVYGNESETEHLSIDYTGLHSVQIKALIDEINKLKEEIRNLKSSNIKLK